MVPRTARLVAALLGSLLVSLPALADWDAALEAREQAVRDAEQRKFQEQERQNRKLKADAQATFEAGQMESKRKTLGAAAKGKSDTQVNAMYDAHIQRLQQDAMRGAAGAKSGMSSGQGAAALKQTTGKSMAEIQNLSDAELDALASEMERMYGN